ncbi:hypothetical protein [Sphingomonas panacis]|uniref:hypothetical protein n=1 Tax=Sphingomonas panacis TaxID=1560345 RepID=UPI001F0A5431|nr:hypothetical protein [Sphingomonas panacis]
MNVSQPAICGLRNGQTRGTGKLLDLARALHTRAGYLISETDDSELAGAVRGDRPSIPDHFRLIPVEEISFELGMDSTFLHDDRETPAHYAPLDRIAHFTESHPSQLRFSRATAANQCAELSSTATWF